MNHKTQVSRLGTGSFISYGRRKSRLKERNTDHSQELKVQIPTTLGETKMAQVTYRGVKYGTDRNKAKQTNKVDLTYRGVRTEKELTSLK